MQKTHNLTISIGSSIKGKVDEFAESCGIKRSDVLRMALYEYLNIPRLLLEGSSQKHGKIKEGEIACTSNCSSAKQQ